MFGRKRQSDLGQRGEQFAEKSLRRSGFKTLGRRFSTPAGELDLIMREGDTIVFVEVKTQRDRAFTDPETRVTRSKQRRLVKAAKWYLVQKGWTERPCRFDVVSVILPESGDAEIEHYRDAFFPDRW